MAFDCRMADEHYSTKETQARVKAAVQGAFITSPKPLKSASPKRLKTQRKSKKPSSDNKRS